MRVVQSGDGQRLWSRSNGAVTDQVDFLPYGGLRSGGPSPGTSHLFTGHQRDLGTTSSELDFMHARHYSPQLGRFLSVDSVGGSVGSSQSWNRYSYVRNNPVNMNDPTGRYEEDVHRGLTTVLALAVGFDVNLATAIAAANQGVDENPNTSAFANERARADFHFASESRRDQLWMSFESNLTPQALGVFLHAEQDSFSHAGYGPKAGHLLAGVACLLFLVQGGFGGGHGRLDLALYLLGFPWVLIPWPSSLGLSDFHWLGLIPFGINLTIAVILRFLFRRN